MKLDKNLLPYVALFVVVVIAAVIAAAEFTSNSYSLSVIMASNRTAIIFPYHTSLFTIKVSNNGGSAIKNLIVGLYLNGTELKHYTVTIPGHNNVTLSANYTYRTSGTFYFQAVADPGKLLNVANRNGTESGVLVNVTAPELPNVYKSIPNGNVVDTQSFVLSGTGMYSTSAIAQTYNLKLMNAVFGSSKNMTAKIFENIYGYIAYAFGASTDYANGTSAYSVWLQGTVTPDLVGLVTSTFRVPMSNATVNGTRIVVARTGNQTSMCTSYSNGWTKMLVYYNNSKNATCLSFMGREYQPTESNTLVDALNSSKEITRYQSGFMYANSTKLGSSLPYSNSAFGVINFFQNDYGLFAGYVQRSVNAVDITANRTCYGITYDNGNTHMCSYITVPTDFSMAQGYGLVNTTEVTANYTVTLYSLVNESNLLAAHQNGAALINALRINGSSARWVQAQKNTCQFNDPSLGCSINSFDYYNNTANLSVRNRLGSPINITGVGCHLPGVKYNALVNGTVKGNSATSLKFECYNMVSALTSVENYEITMNYTRGGINSVAIGTLNVTTAGFP